MRSPLNAIAVLGIRGYRRFLSPRKSWCCAHAYFLGGRTCSAYGLAQFQRRPFHQAVARTRRRLIACAAAADCGRSNEDKQARDRRLNRRALRARRRPRGSGDPDDCFLSPQNCTSRDLWLLAPDDCLWAGCRWP